MMKYVSYVLSAFAFLVFCYSFFFAKEEILMKQAILWFYTALFALLLPEIKHLRYGDIEIDLKQEIREVKEEVKKTAIEVEETFNKKTQELIRKLAQQQLVKLQEDFFKNFPKNLKVAEETIDDTLRYLEDIHRVVPDDPFLQSMRAYTHKNRAMVMQQLGRPVEFEESLENSEKAFKGILEKNQTDAGAWNGLGSIALLRNRPQQALEYIEKALEINPNYTAAQHDRALAKRMLEAQEK